jgi:thioredoxin reductase (NADPH)
VILTNGSEGFWSEQHAEWLKEYQIPVHHGRVEEVEHDEGEIHSIRFESGRRVAVDCAFTMRGDLFHNALAKALNAEVDDEGQIIVTAKHQTSVRGLYAAGCVTPSNCQMIIAAGEGAEAAQAINRDLFEESLETHDLRRIRCHQIEADEIFPEIIE